MAARTCDTALENIHLEEGSTLVIRTTPGAHFHNIRLGPRATLILGFEQSWNLGDVEESD